MIFFSSLPKGKIGSMLEMFCRAKLINQHRHARIKALILTRLTRSGTSNTSMGSGTSIQNKLVRSSSESQGMCRPPVKVVPTSVHGPISRSRHVRASRTAKTRTIESSKPRIPSSKPRHRIAHQPSRTPHAGFGRAPLVAGALQDKLIALLLLSLAWQPTGLQDKLIA